jgi:hypothetical protein
LRRASDLTSDRKEILIRNGSCRIDAIDDDVGLLRVEEPKNRRSFEDIHRQFVEEVVEEFLTLGGILQELGAGNVFLIVP